MSDCKMLIWSYQLVAQCLQMKYARMHSQLSKTLYLTASPAELPLDMKDFLQTCSVSYSGLEACSLNHLTFLWHAACMWQSLVQLHGCFLTQLLLVCAA